jgi:two-component system response regulator GlrR
MTTAKLLVVDDDQNLLELARAKLSAANYDVAVALNGEEALSAAMAGDFDLSIVDLRLSDQDGMTLMERLHGLDPAMPVIILTGYASIEGAVEAMSRGAYTYITKPFDSHELVLQVNRALDKRKLARENQRLKGLLKEKYDFANIVAKSEKMQRVLEAVSRIAPADSTVYVQGESGTGKELIAKAIHLQSRRKDGHFVAINCAAIPESLLESELFGHERGAFTGAVRGTKGLFSEAHGGTLFLDEIGDMPLSIQVKLLRAIEERQFYPVGGNKPLRVDVRIIVATNKDLMEEVRKNRFRADLFYRIHVIPIILPPLKERAEDIPHLVDHLLKKLSRQLNKDVSGLTPNAMQKLMHYHWPGNVRELENTLEFAMTMTRQAVITDDLILPGTAPSSTAANGDGTQSDAALREAQKSLKAAREDFERDYLIRVLELCGGKASQAAKIAGKYRGDLYDLLKKHDIRIAEFKKPN